MPSDTHDVKSLVSLYTAYKKSTTKALDWLLSKVRHQWPNTAHGFINTSQIVEAAEEIKRRNVEVPGDVIYHFKSAIKYRKATCKLYSSTIGEDQDEQIKHKAFIERLEEACSILSSLVKKTKKPKPPSSSQSESSSSSPDINPYACLEDVDVTEDNIPEIASSMEQSTISDKPVRASTLKVEEPRNEEEVLEDDELGEHIEICRIELDAVLSELNKSWTEVADGDLSIIFASFLTSAAYHCIDRHIDRLSRFIPDHESLLAIWKLYTMERQMKIQMKREISGEPCSYNRFYDGLGLVDYFYTVKSWRESQRHKNISNDVGKPQSPARYLTNPQNETEKERLLNLDEEAIEMIQTSMCQLLASKRAISALESDRPSEALIPELDQVLNDETYSIPTRFVVGMEMLMSTYKAFLWPHGNLNTNNCRINALQFAETVRKAVESCMYLITDYSQNSQACVTTLQGFNLYLLKGKLSDYIQEKRFDLYYQAPWIAGGHMAEILNSALLEGMGCCMTSGYLDAVLHLYNALRQVSADIPKIPWLEDMCEIFLKTLFRGYLPTDNFSSVFRRCMGGRPVRENAGRTPPIYKVSKQDPWTGRPDIDFNGLSAFSELHCLGYRPALGFYQTVYTGGVHGHPTKNELNKTFDRYKSQSFDAILRKIKESVSGEFHGRLPVAMLNYFAIFSNCAMVLVKLARRSDNEQVQHMDYANSGFYIVDSLLETIAKYRKDRNLASLHHHDLFQKAIWLLSQTKEYDLAKFLWKV